MEARANGLWGRFRANRLAFALVILVTLTVGILVGSVVSFGVRGQEKKSADATPLTVPPLRQVSSQFTQIAKTLEPAVVNINTVSTIKPAARGGAGNSGDDQGDQFGDFFDKFFGGKGNNGPVHERSLGSGVLVDPKGEDYLRYRGATLLTPNRAEFREVAGRWRNEAELATKAQALRSELALEALLITRSEEGMSLYTDAGAQHFPAQAREVYDVSGAGDTVIATIGALLGADADLASAVRVANLAAGIVVGKLGTAVVHPDELT